MQNLSMKELKENLASKGFQLTPYSEEEINQAKEYFGQLPETLVAYYQLIGKVDLSNNHGAHITIVSPTELIKINGKEGDFIKIADEYCGMFDVAIKTENLNEANPQVYLSGEVAYYVIEDDEEKENELKEAGLLFADEDFIYLSGQVRELSEEMKTQEEDESEDVNYLEDLLTAINYFFRYEEAFLND
ncbi:hypothetical protein [Isobaculum melis]|uniref:SMI1 / KNR4 family (SUKH-1) n=1 Tax=Isobaculum melis TaxID=142588 RepID=A0A1H9PRY0_9LACT|nr:hypothetical protein [Isobaculum melis]SER50987.1 hypothetical protein SAMN04488559_101100 [Isobaculum melis]